MISLIHPSRSRVQKSFETVKKWIDRSSTEIEVIVSIDRNDPELNIYMHHYSTVREVHLIVNDNRSAVDAINNGAKESKGDILIVVSDDSDCPKGWDRIIKDATDGKEDFALKVNDGIQNWIITMPVIDRLYYDRFGYIYYPDYRHMFVDTHFTHVADALGRIIWRNDLHFPHLHYSVKKSDADDVNRRADATWEHGKSLYLSMVSKNLNLSTDVNIWNLSNYASNHLNWLKKQ